MSTDLTRIGEKARREPDLEFTSLYHHVTDMDNLRDCYEALDDDKAVGVDGVTREEYGKDLEGNLHDLSNRLKRMGYKPKAKRRTYVPKSGSAGERRTISVLQMIFLPASSTKQMQMPLGTV